MGYFPNAAARALKTKRSYNLGVLFIDEMQSGLTHAYFASMLDSFKVEAEMRGYDITFISHNIGGRATTFLEHCRYRNVDGVVIACVNFEDPEVTELITSNIPTVSIDRIFHDRMSVLSDNVEGMRALVHYIYDKGHRKIAYIHGERTSVAQNRLVSFYQTCEELNLHLPENFVLESRFHAPEITANRVQELILLKDRPTCIFLPDDYSYPAVLSVIREEGLRVPQDISIVGYDGIDVYRMLQPMLVTYRQDAQQMGKVAAEQLVGLIEKPRTTLPRRIVIPGRVLEGGSVSRLV